MVCLVWDALSAPEDRREAVGAETLDLCRNQFPVLMMIGMVTLVQGVGSQFLGQSGVAVLVVCKAVDEFVQVLGFALGKKFEVCVVAICHDCNIYLVGISVK
jgi:hypothetical protein